MGSDINLWVALSDEDGGGGDGGGGDGGGGSGVVIIAVVVASDRTNFRVVLKALHREIVRLPFRSLPLMWHLTFMIVTVVVLIVMMVVDVLVTALLF